MKPLFAIDVTENKNNDTLNSERFVTRTTHSAQADALEREGESAEEIIKGAKLPLPLRIAQYILLIAGAVILGGIFRALGEQTSLALAYERAGYLFWICGACLVLGGALFAVSFFRMKKLQRNDELKLHSSRAEELIENIFDELGVPDGAPDVDILCFSYKVKNGEPVPTASIFSYTPYVTAVTRVFIDTDKLCFADTSNRYDIPLSSLKGIRTVNKKISIPDWNKETPPNKGIYKPFRMTVNDKTGCIYFKPYYILELTYGGEDYGIYFPCYELDVIERLSGMQAEPYAANGKDTEDN